MTTTVEIRHFHLFVGLGGGARGFNRASPRVGNLQARFRCIGGIDITAAYRRLASAAHPDRGGTPERMAEINRARDEGLAA